MAFNQIDSHSNTRMADTLYKHCDVSHGNTMKMGMVPSYAMNTNQNAENPSTQNHFHKIQDAHTTFKTNRCKPC